VIAADEGIMPQTREHFEICRLLGVKNGLVALTKTDLVDEELLELVRLETAELVSGSFLEGAPVLAVSSRTGDGIESLKASLSDVASAVPTRSGDVVTRLPIDRSFTVKGFGAVVTGTLASGEIREAEELEILPAGKTVRVRGIQTHGRSVSSAHAGQRTAVNLGGVEHHEIKRGMILSEKGVLRPTQILDAEVEVLKAAKNALRSRQRVRLHIGTVEALARVQVLDDSGRIEPGETGFAQLRLEVPTVAVPFERFIIRSYSPQATIAGGRVLDPLAAKHRKKDITAADAYLDKTSRSEHDDGARLRGLLAAAGRNGLTLSDIRAKTGWPARAASSLIETGKRAGSIIDAEDRFVDRTSFDELKRLTLDAVKESQDRDPLSKGITRELLRDKVFPYLDASVFRAVTADLERSGEIRSERETVRLASHIAQLSPDEETLRANLTNYYDAAGFEVLKLDEVLTEAAKNTKLNRDRVQKVFRLLVDSGDPVKVTEDFYFSAAAIKELIAKVRKYADSTGDRLIDVASIKDLAGISRKYAIPLLEFFDRRKVTVRAGDKRLVLK
jgi:selenocysteine-specific elongation factor